MDSKAGKALWASLNVVISAGLGHILTMARSLTAQELRFRKTCAVARFRGRDLPSRQPPFKSWDTSSTFFPPSKRILNQALSYLKEGNPAQPSRQAALAYASGKGIPSRTGESLWLAIRYTESRIGPEGVNSIQAEQIPLASPPSTHLHSLQVCDMSWELGGSTDQVRRVWDSSLLLHQVQEI